MTPATTPFLGPKAVELTRAPHLFAESIFSVFSEAEASKDAMSVSQGIHFCASMHDSWWDTCFPCLVRIQPLNCEHVHFFVPLLGLRGRGAPQGPGDLSPLGGARARGEREPPAGAGGAGGGQRGGEAGEA